MQQDHATVLDTSLRATSWHCWHWMFTNGIRCQTQM